MIANMTVGMIQEHTYFFIDDKTKHGFIVDPGEEGERILKYIKEQGFIIEKILITHGHFDLLLTSLCLSFLICTME